MSKGRELETIISIAGKVEASLKRSIKDVSAELERMQAAVKQSATATDKLEIAIKDQASELDAAKRKYMDYILSGEKSSKQAKEMKKKIQQLSGELNDNKTKMSAAEKAANRLAGEFDDVGDSARDSGDGIGIMDIALGNLVANGITAAISKAKDAAQAIYGLAESTREYREDLSKLETAFETAGHSTEEGTAVYKELFSVFGEEDRAVEAAQQIAKLADSEEEMSRMTEIATGAWAMWGDSLATESLMEAMNSTAKIGTVQGTLADALEWCGINLDTFNEALEGMNTEEERSAFILDTLDGLYSKSAENYRENNASIIAAREAQSDYNDKLAEIGEKIEPVTTAVQKGLTKILDKFLELTSGIDMDALVEKISSGFDTFVNDVIPKVMDGLQWIVDNKDIITSAISGIAAGFVAFKAAKMITGIFDAVQKAGGAVKFLSGALSFLSSPITWIVIAIAALVAAGVWLYQNWDLVKEKAAQLAAWLSEKWAAIKTSISNAWENVKTKTSETWNAIKTSLSNAWANIKASVSNVWTSITTAISTAWNNIKTKAAEMVTNVKTKISTGFSALKNIMLKPFKAVAEFIDTLSGKIGGVVGKIKEVGGGIVGKIADKIPFFASGGFTNGVSIAGEAGTEAVISFDPAYRSENLSYWAKAGRMLGADFSDFSLGGGSSETYFDMGGVTFSPNIVIHGHADKQSVMEAIEAEYPEFIDMLEEWFARKGVTAYA